MNKQELIKHFEEMEYVSIVQMGKKAFIDMIEQLDEPQKVTVPQFVADWIEWTKKDGLDLQDAMNLIAGEQNEKLLRWFYYESKQETFARAWLDGFEIEKEKRYLVKIVGMDNINGYLSYNKKLKKWFFGIASESRPYRLKHTRKELEEDGFGWVLDCPGVEVEEVEK